jgi:SAM-dependent methyltransferase
VTTSLQPPAGASGIDGAFFDKVYEGQPPWEIDMPQPAVVQLHEAGMIGARVLDCGCGTGENALYLARLGFHVTAIDAAPRAIALARDKAQRQGVELDLRVHDALDLGALNLAFDTIIDTGLFHVFSDADRLRYVQSLAAALRPGGCLHVLCFSERETSEGGPRRVSQCELRSAFADGWQVVSIEADYYLTRIHDGGARAWRAHMRKLP